MENGRLSSWNIWWKNRPLDGVGAAVAAENSVRIGTKKEKKRSDARLDGRPEPIRRPFDKFPTVQGGLGIGWWTTNREPYCCSPQLRAKSKVISFCLVFCFLFGIRTQKENSLMNGRHWGVVDRGDVSVGQSAVDVISYLWHLRWLPLERRKKNEKQKGTETSNWKEKTAHRPPKRHNRKFQKPQDAEENLGESHSKTRPNSATPRRWRPIKRNAI